jgi:hypothetical protein
VRDQRVVAARQHRGELPRKRREDRVAHEVDAAVDAVKAPVAEAALDRPNADPRSDELSAGHEPALARRETRGDGIAGKLNHVGPRETSLRFAAV